MEIEFYHHKLLVGLVQYFFKSSSFSTVITNITDYFGSRKLSVAVPSHNSDVAESNDVYWNLHVFLCNTWCLLKFACVSLQHVVFIEICMCFFATRGLFFHHFYWFYYEKITYKVIIFFKNANNKLTAVE